MAQSGESPASHRTLRSGVSIPPLASTSARSGANPEIDELALSEELPNSSPSALQLQLDELRKRNNILDNLVIEYRRMYGEQLNEYPPEVAARARLLQTLPSDPQRSRSYSRADEAPARRRSLSPRQVPRDRPRHMGPETYDGKTQQELTEYMQACNRTFDYDPQGYPDSVSRIKWAATFLRKEPANAWERFRRNEPDALLDMTWQKYKEFLENLQLQPTSRRVIKAKAHEDAKQRVGQSILEFVNYLEEKEEYMEPYTERQKRDILFNKIRPEYRRQLVENGRADDLTTRDQIISAVALQETYILRDISREKAKSEKEASKDRKPEKESKSHRPHKSGERQAHHRQRNDKAANPNHILVRDKIKDSRFLKSVTCYTCNKQGHYSNDCPEKVAGGSKDKHQGAARLASASTTLPGSSLQKLEVKLRIEVEGGWKDLTALIDSGAEDNFISRLVVKECNLRLTGDGPKTFKTLPDYESVVFGTTKPKVEITDTMGQTKLEEVQLRVIDMPGVDLILGWPWLEGTDPQISFKTKQWRYPYNLEGMDFVNRDRFAKLSNRKGAQTFAFLPTLNSVRRLSTDKGPAIPDEYSEFADVFSEESADELPPLEGRQHPIILEEGTIPPYSPIYNLSEAELEVLRDYLNTSEAKGWIRKSTSPAGAPILFVPKKDGGLRLCVDYRALNKLTIKNRYPLPLISETLDRLRDAQVFTSLDLRNAYHRVRIRPGDEWKTAFRTRYGHYEYQVMPFGLSNAPATFQAYINDALAGLVDVICVVYLDDILIYSSDPRQHISHVCQVLERLRQYNLFAKLSKCSFHTKTVEFLGYVISTTGVSMEKSRVAAIQEWPQPESVRDVQVFIGFANFYRRFVRDFSAIARPLTCIMKGRKKGQPPPPFEWGEEQQLAFDRLKTAFTSAPFLMHFDPAKPRRLETDASGFAYAGILSQPTEWPAEDGRSPIWHPIAFHSKKLEPAELNYETHDQELLAIVKCFVHWRHYLEGSIAPIEVLTDHSNLRHFMTTSALSRRQARWALELSAYDFVIAYRPGKSNPADGPSRRPDYEPAKYEQNVMLPTLQNKLRVAIQKGLVRGRGQAIDSTESSRTRDEKSYGVAQIQKPSGGDSKAEPPTEAIDTAGLDQPHVLMQLNSSKNSFEGLDTLLRDASEAPDAGQSSHEYSVPRFFVAGIMNTETAFSPPSSSLLPLLLELQKEDVLAIEKRAYSRGHAGDAVWSVDSKGLLRHRQKAYVPQDNAVRAEIMKICHDDPTAGHFGHKKTLKLVQQKYYWHAMSQDVKEYVRGCDICQRTKARRTRNAGEMQALPLPSRPFESITMDFITDLPPSIASTTGRIADSLLVIVDRYTKEVEYIPCLKTTDALELARLFIDRWFKDHGLPASIISDRGSVFTSRFWSELCFHLGITRGLSTAFHPQTDGQTERQNQTLEGWLRCYVCYMQDNWADLLALAKFAYMNAYHDSIGMTPNEARYGITLETRQGIEDDPQRREIPTAKERAKEVIEKRQQLETSWRKTKESQAKWYNKYHRPVEFKVGDMVLLSSKNIKTVRTSKKLDDRFLGPFRIEQRIGKQAYRLKLPRKYSRLHPVFHISLLELYHKRAGETLNIIQPDLIDGEEVYEVKDVLDRRIKNGNEEYLIRWKGYGPADDSWEPRKNLNNLEDKIKLLQGRDAAKRPAKRRRRNY
jgi:hypothetical protein